MPGYLTARGRRVLLVGAGAMALEYARILRALRRSFEVVGRGAETARKFTRQTGVAVTTGGVQSWLAGSPDIPDRAIVAVDVGELAPVVEQLMHRGVRNILVEKPGGLTGAQICRIAGLALRKGAAVYAAYNRRFYDSVRKARAIAAEDGGIISFSFDFTELSERVIKSAAGPEVKQNWFLANSSHVVDLAFFLGGEPAVLSGFVSGGNSWHTAGTIFSGAGRTVTGALFSYQANWEVPGRWGVELVTRGRRMILCPLEELYEQTGPLGEKKRCETEDNLDSVYKPGLYRMVRAFLYHEEISSLPTLESQCSRATGVYCKILRGEAMCVVRIRNS